jgi:hypothetical protein
LRHSARSERRACAHQADHLRLDQVRGRDDFESIGAPGKIPRIERRAVPVLDVRESRSAQRCVELVRLEIAPPRLAECSHAFCQRLVTGTGRCIAHRCWRHDEIEYDGCARRRAGSDRRERVEHRKPVEIHGHSEPREQRRVLAREARGFERTAE